MIICFVENATTISAATGINDQISFQGKVVNTDGTNVANGSYDFVFSIYTVSSGGTAVWTETWNSGTSQVTVTDGIFQVSLGTHTDLPGSIDFNTDNIYLGIEFNGDGEMSPRVHFTAAPYAFNAMKVAGLTVTDTTGTLTIPNGETISFGGSFTTTASNDVTLTTSGATNVTLPTTGTLATLAGSEILTNKTIGSTGLTFSGATTDITTATGENLVLEGAGSGVIQLNDATTAVGTITFSGPSTDITTGTDQDLTLIGNGTGIINLNDSVTSGALTISGAATDITTGANESLVIVANGSGVIDLQDATTVDSLTTDTGGVSIAAGQSYTGSGAVTVSSATTNALTLDSGTTGTVNLGTGNNAKIIAIGTGTAGNTINVGTDNTIKDTINIGSALDDVAITGDQWSITNAGVLTVVSCSGCGGGGSTLDSAYAAGNTITTDSGSNVIITLQEVVIPTSFVIENQDTAGVSAQRVFNSIASGTLTNGLLIEQTGAGTMTNALQIAETAGTITDGILITGTLANILNSGSIDITGAGAITGATGVSTTTVSASSTIDAQGDVLDTTGNLTLNDAVDISGALAANGGITFDASTDTVGAFTAAGTIDMNTNILTNIGNSGTDFVASTGALTLAGVLTANGGITLASSQTFTASSLSYMDLGAITHGTTAVQGLRLPQAASASPSSPTSGEGYLAWDAGGNQVIYYNGSAWATFGAGGGYATIKDESTSLTQRTTLAFLGAGVSCADNVTQTECTISGGAGSDLQGTYGADADGGNATISLTSADDGLVFTNPTSAGTDSAFLLQLTQQNTTAAVTVLDMTQSSNAANAMNLTANSIDTETGLAITTNGLTSGKGISIASSSTTATGNLADISLTGSDAGNTGNVLAVSNTGTANTNTALFVDHRATGTGNLALRVDDEASDTTPFIIDGAGRVGIATASISEDASTERLLQVGSETNRGNSVTYGEVVTKGQRDITALANIRDVFVYDTTMDSDGGRWIDWATTDKLSWYTEILDDGPSDPCDIANDDRCYKAAFPRKAILVVTTDALYVFDAQDNTMWMKFSQNALGYALGVDTSNDPSSVTALNGVIYVGTNGASAGGLYAIDFTTDRMWKYDSTDRSQGDVGIGSRNSAVTYNSDNNTNFDLGNDTGWDAVNDVSGAVMQFSTTGITIGAATNLAPNNGTTLIAIATDSGLGVINLSRQRYLAYSDTTDDNYNAVAITRTGKLYGLNNTLDQAEKWINIDQDQVSEENGTPDKVWDQASTPALSRVTPSIATGAPDALEVVERGSLADGGLLSTATVPGSSDLIYVGTDQGLAEIHDHSTAGSGWSKFYTTTQQTSLMPGTIKRAHMMEDASGDLTDSSFRANTMAPIGGITYGINGVRGKGVTLNGTSGFFCSDNGGATCAADTDDNMSTTAWNIQMWFKHSTTQAGNDVLYSRCYTTTPAAASACVTIYMTSTGTMVGALDDDATWTAYSSYDQMATSTRTYNDNQWHHVVLARDNANDVNMYIDGTPLNLSTATGSTLTLDASQLVAIGADCSVGAACATGANFWDGSIDDFTFSQGTTTVDALTTTQARRLYNDARPLVNRKVITVTDATTVTSTTIGDSGEAWLPNEFVGQVMEITGGTGAGQTRRVISNTTTTLTVSPAFSTTPDTTSDFEINPEVLYGAVNGVTAIGITAESPLGEARQLCVGTNNGSDGGGVTCLNHQAGPNIVADVYHGDSEQTDDSGTEWTGTDYDDIQSIDISGRAFVMGTMAHFWTETEDVRLGQGMDYMSNKISDLTNHIKNLGMQTLAGSGSMEIGLTGGADLAERYYSNEPLQAGEVVAIDSSLEAGVKKTTSRSQRDTLGVVATAPGLILGPEAANGYPIALVGRVPVKVTFENGPIYAGDRITSASRPGFAMRATQAGRVIGTALSDAVDWVVCEGEDPDDPKALLCTTVMVFVNLTDYYGQSVELAMTEKTKSVGLTTPEVTDETGLGADGAVVKLATTEATREERIMQFLKEVRDEKIKYTDQSSEVFTDRVAASTEIITPKLVVDEIFAKSIKADSIEGLSLWTDRIASLQAKYAGLVPKTGNTDANPAEAVLGTERTLLNLEQFVVGAFTTRLDASILGKLSVTGALTVADAAEFQGETTFARLATFMNEALFRGKVAFEKVPTFSADTAGFATITEGEKRVRITFDEAYARQPIVAVTLTRDISPLLEDSADDTLRSDVAEVEREYVKGVFDTNIRYIVTEKDQTGFTILLSDKAPADLSFSWVAIAVDRPRTSISQPEKEGEDGKSEREDEIVLPETPVAPAEEEALLPEPTALPVEKTPTLTPGQESVAATPESETI